MLRFLFIILIFSNTLQAQYPSYPDYPKGYFRNPLNVAMDLSGNFGELRPNHYHMGLDLKTLRRENLPVYAAADGYISRIKIEPGGFGRAVYITHPNGFTTLYCHLNDFVPSLENWVKQLQYSKESWSIYEEVPPSLFPVKKGDLIAYSGNTGGSQAPHVHFEIRRTADDINLNPCLFGFPLQDDTRPSILRLAIYDRTLGLYEQTPRLIPLSSRGNGLYVAAPVKVSTPKISLALTAYDTHTGSSNLNGIFEAVLYNDNRAVVGFRMNEIGYDATRYLNAHIDYKTKENKGPYLQHLSELPGYYHSIYKQFSGDGVIDLSDGAVHGLSVIVKDAYGNASTATVSVQYNRNYMMKAPSPGKRFYPMMVDVFEADACEFIIGDRTLYDSVAIAYKKMPASNALVISDIHTIGAPYIPMQDSMIVRIKPVKDLLEEDRERVVMQRFTGSEKEVQKVSWQKNWAMARFREFGSFQLVADKEPPTIVPVGFTDGSNLSAASRLMFTIKDNLERCKLIRAELDGKWLRFTNDKGRYFIYQFDEKCLPGSHHLKIIATDEAGNTIEKEFGFTR
jgi:murein DD-endopeptidase MepM/ murein hydrolase activator NlpD